ncbi:MAG: hypothetical protein LH468_01090 [Nocardioides sp.]|nr:hypothetical protein [Nocardioides sp.]
MTTWEIDGATALRTHAPDAASAYDAAVEVRPLRVHDEVLLDPAVRAFSEQLRADAAGVGDDLRVGLARATGDHLGAVTQMVWIGDLGSRVRAALDALFTPSQWESPRRFPVADLNVVITALRRAVPKLGVADDVAGTRAALVDAVMRTPADVPADVVEAVRRDLHPAQAVAAVLGAALEAADSITVALGAEHPEVTSGVWAATTEADRVG